MTVEVLTIQKKIEEMPRIELLNDFIEQMLPLLKTQVDAMPTVKPRGYEELNRLFVDTVYNRVDDGMSKMRLTT